MAPKPMLWPHGHTKTHALSTRCALGSYSTVPGTQCIALSSTDRGVVPVAQDLALSSAVSGIVPGAQDHTLSCAGKSTAPVALTLAPRGAAQHSGLQRTPGVQQ